MIVVLGDIAVDIISRLRAPLVIGSDAAAEIQLMPGGSGANVAVWMARLGKPVAFVGRVGDDRFGRWLAADLRAEGVSPALYLDARRRTTVIQVLVEPSGERTMVPDRGANAWWPPDDVPEELIAGADLLHVVGYVLLDADSRGGAMRAMQVARSHRVPISLDPSSHAPLRAMGIDLFWELVGRLDVLLPNRVEALTMTGAPDVEAAAGALLAHAGVVAIKLDKDGCMARTGRARWRVPAVATEVVNATGAGDAFDAAFLARWLTDGDTEAACREGVRLGAWAAGLASTR